MSFLNNIPLISDLGHLIEALLLFNIVLTGVVILLAFRVTYYRNKAEELESEINESIRETINRESPDQPVTRRRASRR